MFKIIICDKIYLLQSIIIMVYSLHVHAHVIFFMDTCTL